MVGAAILGTALICAALAGWAWFLFGGLATWAAVLGATGSTLGGVLGVVCLGLAGSAASDLEDALDRPDPEFASGGQS